MGSKSEKKKRKKQKEMQTGKTSMVASALEQMSKVVSDD